MWQYTYQDELYHYGILGMKWGVRRYQNKDGTRTALGKKRRAEGEGLVDKAKKKISESVANKKAKKAEEQRKVMPSKKAIRSMSDAELKEKINRLNLEKDYKKLLSETRPETNEKGKKFVMDILETSGKNIGVQLATYGMGTITNKVLQKLLDSDENFVNPKKGQKDK